MKQLMRHSIWSVMVTLFSVVMVAAQGAQCTGLLEDALIAVEENCVGTGRNQACYGFNSVSASFLTEVGDDFFTQPSDLSEIVDLETIQTAALDVENDIWGVALMNIQADLPNTLPGQNVTFVLLGDVEVGSNVDPDNTFEPVDGIEVTITTPAGANIRSGAGLNFNVVGGARADSVLVADGLSPDGDWLRIAYDEDRVGWINRVVIDESVEGLDDLPVLTNELQTPMQSFYLRTGIGTPECEDVPDDVLLVQGPENIQVSFTVNGAEIQLGSTVALRLVENENGVVVMQIIGISGRIEVGGVRVFPGQVTTYVINENAEGKPFVVGDPSPPEPFTEFGEEYCVLEQLPLSLLNYEIEILCPGEVIPTTNSGNTVDGATDSQVSGVNCSTFGLISPLQPVNSGVQTFSWTPVQGNNIDYVVVFYDSSGLAVNEFRTPNTTLTINLGADTNTGGSFSWEVRAYQNTVDYACVTFRSPSLVRTGELNPPVVPATAEPNAPFSASLVCNYPDGPVEAIISWQGAPSGVLITYVDGYESQGSTSSLSSSGTITIDHPYGFLDIYITDSIENLYLGFCDF